MFESMVTIPADCRVIRNEEYDSMRDEIAEMKKLVEKVKDKERRIVELMVDEGVDSDGEFHEYYSVPINYLRKIIGISVDDLKDIAERSVKESEGE